MVKVPFQGRQVDARVVDFITRKEDFNEYQLVNGGVLRIKLVTTRILQLEGEKDPEGSPIYIIQSTNVVAPPEVVDE